jgi:thiosulfate reductase cytochrome b subunit
VEKIEMDGGRNYLAHSLPVRIMHWLGATAVICIILSGWQIYNASPLLPSTFRRWMTLGGWRSGGIAWHLSAMWVLFAVARRATK